jgi:hypothetical protein
LTKLAPLAVNIHLLRDYRSLDAAREAGFQFVRMDMLWSNVERHGSYRFFAYDALLRALESRGMGVLWILDYGHPEHGGKVPRTPENVAAFSRFAEGAAAHFKGHNVRYEVWNEPDTAHFWPPAPNAQEYSFLLRQAVIAIRSADPSAKVSNGGVSRVDLPFLKQAIDHTFAGKLNAIAIHPYPEPNPEQLSLSSLTGLRAWVDETLGSSTEIWDTEWGYPSTIQGDPRSDGHSDRGRKRQAVLAAREILTFWSLGLPLGVWYGLKDDGTEPRNPDHNYGLLDASGEEKPAMIAIRTLLHATNGRTYAGTVRELSPQIHAMRFDGTSNSLFIVWSDKPSRHQAVEVAPTDFIKGEDIVGQSLTARQKSRHPIKFPLDEAAGPIYLYLRRFVPKDATTIGDPEPSSVTLRAE